MEIIIQPDAAEAAELAARVIQREIETNPQSVLGLATGRTMEFVYARLAALHQQDGLDFSGCRTFNLDEYVGLPGQHENSYRFYMDQHLFGRVNIDRKKTRVPDGMAADLAAECAGYERRIRRSGGIDLQLLGLGLSGHLGFNEPLSAFGSRTRTVALAPATLQQNASLFPEPELMPRQAITMGLGTILESRRCLLLATGAAKSEIVAATIEGAVTCTVPASALQLHPDCLIILDEAGASRLRNLEYIRWMQQRDLKWGWLREVPPVSPDVNVGAVPIEQARQLEPAV